MMEALLGSGLQEAGLILFTTLMPSGAVAVFCLAVLIAAGGAGDSVRISRYLAVPLGAALVGFVASTTRLGTPANALYVLFGIGRSPLSNEVAAAVVFFGVTSLYWLMSFGNRLPRWLAKSWAFVAGVAALFSVGMVSQAYAAPTIPTWSSDYVPIVLLLSAFTGGPLIALLTIKIADVDVSRLVIRLLLIASALACVACCVVMFLQADSLDGIRNLLTTASSLVPHYRMFAAVYLAFGLGGSLLVRMGMRVSGRTSVLFVVAGTMVALLGVFFIRCEFYSMYMTVGF